VQALEGQLQAAQAAAAEAEAKLQQSYEEMGELQFQADQAQATAAAAQQQLEARVAELEAGVKVRRGAVPMQPPMQPPMPMQRAAVRPCRSGCPPSCRWTPALCCPPRRARRSSWR
jgi:hypothetical protein